MKWGLGLSMTYTYASFQLLENVANLTLAPRIRITNGILLAQITIFKPFLLSCSISRSSTWTKELQRPFESPNIAYQKLSRAFQELVILKNSKPETISIQKVAL